MSSVASFFVLPRAELKNLKAIAKNLPKRKRKEGSRVVATKDTENSYPYEDFWKFLNERGKEPFAFKWSGEVILGVLAYLKSKGVDLTKSQFATSDDYFPWLEFNEGMKDEYFSQLIPSKEYVTEAVDWCKDNFSSLPPEAVKDAIDVIHKYFESIHSNNVVLFNTEDLDSLLIKPSKTAKKQKVRRFLYMCDVCGGKFETGGVAKKIATTLEEMPQTCGTAFAIITKIVDDTEVEYIVDSTLRTEHSCSAPATGYYKYVF